MPWAAAAAAAASLGGAYMQSESAKDAGREQTQATNEGIGVQRRQFAATRADTAPFRAAGSSAISALTGLTGTAAGTPKDYKDWTREDFVNAYKQLFAERGAPDQALSTFLPEIENRIGDLDNPAVRQYFDDIGLKKFGPSEAGTGQTQESVLSSPLLRRFSMADLESDPVYQKEFQFGLDEGEKAVRRMFGAKGLARSGAAVKAASRFATDYTGTKAGAARDRFVADQSNTFNKLAAQSGIGQAATTTTAQLGAQNATSIGDMIVGGGNARGASSIAQGNAYGSGLSNAGNTIMGQYYMNQLNQPRSQPRTYTTTPNMEVS